MMVGFDTGSGRDESSQQDPYHMYSTVLLDPRAGSGAGGAGATRSSSSVAAAPNNDNHQGTERNDNQRGNDRITGEERHAETAAISRTVTLMGLAAYSLAYVIQSGIENGVGPCILTTLKDDFGLENTFTVSFALQASEAAKIIGSLVIGYLAQTEHRILITLIGTLVWSAGTIVVGISPNIYILGVGCFIFGLGYSTTTVICPTAFYQVTQGGDNDQRQTFYISVAYAASAGGIVVGTIACAFTTAYWRVHFLVWPLGLIPVIFLLLAVYKGVRHTFKKNEDDHKKIGPPALPTGSTDGDVQQREAPAAGATETNTTKKTKSVGMRRIFKNVASGQKDNPPLCQALRVVLSNKGIQGTILMQTFTGFYISAFSQLTPKFVEDMLTDPNEDKLARRRTGSLVLGATVPCVVGGILLGGFLCKKFRFKLSNMMLFCGITFLATAPCMCMWFTKSLPFFIVCIMITMVMAFMNGSPQTSALALSCDLADKLNRHDPNRFDVGALASLSVGASSFISRLLGSYTGPLVLSAMIDNSKSNPEAWLSYEGCYMVVGFIGTICCTLSAVFGWYHTRQMELRLEKMMKNQQQAEARETGGGGEADLFQAFLKARGDSEMVLKTPLHKNSKLSYATPDPGLDNDI